MIVFPMIGVLFCAVAIMLLVIGFAFGDGWESDTWDLINRLSKSIFFTGVLLVLIYGLYMIGLEIIKQLF